MPSHWGWVAQFEGKIFYGDSLNLGDGRTAPQEVLQQMASLFPHHIKSSTHFTLPYTSVAVDKQPDVVSCGVYALAGIVLIVSGTVTPPGMSQVAFDAPKLWDWLLGCWDADRLDLPPFTQTSGGLELMANEHTFTERPRLVERRLGGRVDLVEVGGE
jgi:hypothetical protein